MLKKILILVFAVFSITVILSFAKEKKQKAVRTIVIDAGHGMMPNGGYNGAKGSYSYEDEICLAVSQKLVSQVAKELPDIKIVQTRTDKYIVDLHERADIAN